MERTLDIDSGWAWVAVTAAFFSMVFSFGIGWSSGVFYVIFLDHLEFADPSEVALGVSLGVGILFGIGPFAGVLINAFGCRQVGLVGGVLAGAGVALTALSANVYYMAAMFGALTGIGFGMNYLAAITASTWHFEKYRAVAMSIATAGVGMGVLLYPMLIRYLYVTFGWRGALFILGGITCNMIACGATFPRKRRKLPNKDHGSEPTKPTDVWNIRIFRNIDYTLLCFNSLFNCIGLSVVYVHMAAYAADAGVDPDRSALLVTIIGVSNFLGRFIYTGLVQISCCSSLILHVAGYCLLGAFTFLVPLSLHYGWLALYSAMFGTLSASIGAMLPLIIVDLIGAEQMASGYGNQLFFQAIGQTAGGPIAGMILKYTGSYSSCMYFAGGSLLFAAILMIKPLVSSYQSKEIRTVSVTIGATESETHA